MVVTNNDVKKLEKRFFFSFLESTKKKKRNAGLLKQMRRCPRNNSIFFFGLTVFASFKYLKMPISIKIPVTIPQLCLHLHDSYISKSDFINYIFANLVVAWLYMLRLYLWQCV